MSLPEVAIEYITSGKRHTAGIARMIRTIGVVVCMSCQSRPSLVSLVANIAFVHAARCWRRIPFMLTSELSAYDSPSLSAVKSKVACIREALESASSREHEGSCFSEIWNMRMASE
jgi:hypothetical protein